MPRLGALEATTTSDSRCDAFWTAMNGGVCSDTLGNYLRSDGTSVPFDELVAAGKADQSSVGKFVVVGSAVLFGILLLKAFRSN